MADYRLYSLNGRGRISLADWIEADSDQEAIAEARRMKRGALECEVWLNDRLVATLRPEESEGPGLSQPPPTSAAPSP